MADTNGRNGRNVDNTNNVPVPVEGRDAKGRFLPGNPGGPGNPLTKATRMWTDTFARCITAEDVEEVTLKLVTLAKGGDMVAIKYMLDRCLGKSDGLLLAVESEGPTRIVFRLDPEA